MRFLITIFIASTIFAPSLAAPSRVAQNDHLLAYDRRTSPKTPPKQNITPGDVPSVGNEGPFKLDDHLNSWLSDESTKKKVYYADSTDGGWEGWAQFEFEVYLRNEMSYSSNKRVREIQVYDGNSKAADFTIEPSQQENRKGMVVELKCENKNSLAGTKVATAFAEDIKKLQGKLKTPYAGSDKVAIVMAYSKEAKDKLDAMKNQNVISISIPTVTVGESQLPLKVYRWDPENDTKDDTELVTDDMSKLGFSDIKCKRGTSACTSNTASLSTAKTSKTSMPTSRTSKTSSSAKMTITSSPTSTNSKDSSSAKTDKTTSSIHTSKISTSAKTSKTPSPTVKTSKTSKAL